MDATDNAEQDEFARLLAQLNGTPEPAAPELAASPAPMIPPAPAFPPPAPAMAPPSMPETAMPAPAMAETVMPPPAMPAASQPPVAPAFGAAAPYPPRAEPAAAPFDPPPGGASALTFPTFAPPPVEVAPVAPPLPRAPELMGADELAAPPRSVPLSGPVPTLVNPSQYGAQPAPGASSQDLFESPPPFSAPQPTPFATAPAPSAPSLFAPESPAPSGLAAPSFAAQQPMAAPVAAPMMAPPTMAPPTTAPAASPSAARAPRDFASLLTAPVGADDDPGSPAAPLRFAAGSSDDDDDEPDIGRSTAAEKVGLVLAFLVAPIGLLVALVAAARSARRRGWVIGIVRASIAIAAVFTVAIGIGGYYEYTQLKQQQAHDQIAASSAAFCSTIKANPSMAQLPTFGWPAVAASIPESLKAMQAYEDRWTKLAKVSPAGIKPGVTSVAAAAKKIIDAVTVARTVDDASNVAVMSSVASSSGVDGWHSEYCG